MKRLILLLMMIVLVGTAAFAINSTDQQMLVYATYTPQISFTVPTLYFGEFYPGLSTDPVTTGNIVVQAPSGQEFAITISGGSFYNGNRNVEGSGGSAFPLPYLLKYSGNLWGDSGFPGSTNGWSAVVDSGVGSPKNYEVDAELLVGYAVPGMPTGTYYDYVVVTVWY